MFRVKTLLLLAILLILSNVLACKSQNNDETEQAVAPAVVKIGYTPLIYAQPTFVAIEKGFFEEVGIKPEVTRYENSTQIVNSVISGGLDFCAITPVLSVFAAESKVTQSDSLFKIMYYNLDSTQHPISFMLVKKGSEIKTLKDLKGKTIGVFPGNILSRVATKLLLKDFMDVERDIKFQDVGPQVQGQAIESGQIDAMFCLEPYATITMEKGMAEILHVAPQLSLCEPLAGGCGMISTSFAKQNPEVAKKFEAAIQKATDFIRSNPEYAKEVLVKYTPLTESLALKVNQPEYKTSREMDGSLLQSEYDVLVREGILEKTMDTRNLIYKSHWM